eukprot:2797186-Prymnesium_polylepis.1
MCARAANPVGARSSRGVTRRACHSQTTAARNQQEGDVLAVKVAGGVEQAERRSLYLAQQPPRL